MTSVDPYQITLGITQRISCFLSMIGSLMIISQISRSPFNRSKTQQRLILGISICDFNTSAMWFFSNLFMPPGSALAAVGNQATCDAHGFIILFNCTSGVLYMCALQLQYLWAVKYGWPERKIRKIEPYLHGFPIVFSLATATTGLALKLYNPAGWNCWIGPLPSDCVSSHQVKKGGTDLTETNCERGDNAEIYRWAFFYAPLWVAIIFCLFVMYELYKSVYKVERRSRRSREIFDLNTSFKNSMQYSYEVKIQSYLYAGSFFTVWTFPTIVRLIQLFGGSIHPLLIILAGTFVGSQGCFNCLIYFRPRYKKCTLPSKPLRLWKLVHSTLFFCCFTEDYTNDSKDYLPSESSLHPDHHHKSSANSHVQEEKVEIEPCDE